MKTKWTSTVPKAEGWYWVKYRGKRRVVICPASVYIFNSDTALIHTARNDMMRGERLEGLKFGPIIPFPA